MQALDTTADTPAARRGAEPLLAPARKPFSPVKDAIVPRPYEGVDEPLSSPAWMQAQRPALRLKLIQQAPRQGESASDYADRCLAAVLPVGPPDFSLRFARLYRNDPLRMLSIGAGERGVEEEMLKGCLVPIDLTLAGGSEVSLRRMANRLAAAGRSVHLLVGDVGDGLPGAGSYDIIACGGVLASVPRLERMLSQVNERLNPHGEFWCVGEQLGRHGAGWWPEATHAAHAVFQRLPSRYRRNAGTRQVDDVPVGGDAVGIERTDVRSEEIAGLLESYLIPVETHKWNCFLWRLAGKAYAGNYDLSRPEDLHYLREVILDEVLHWMNGGRGTQLCGVYRSKRY